MAKFLEKLKNRGFWAGILTAAAGLIGGSMTAPEALIQFVNLLSGVFGG